MSRGIKHSVVAGTPQHLDQTYSRCTATLRTL
ncbi:hypothetical protein PT2222_330087 [Paraburkholderia tropica]